MEHAHKQAIHPCSRIYVLHLVNPTLLLFADKIRKATDHLQVAIHPGLFETVEGRLEKHLWWLPLTALEGRGGRALSSQGPLRLDSD